MSRPNEMHPSNRVTLDTISEVVRYHAPHPDQIERHARIAAAAEGLARAILEHAPDCADRSTALREVRSAKMWASAAIALELRPPADETTKP